MPAVAALFYVLVVVVVNHAVHAARAVLVLNLVLR